MADAGAGGWTPPVDLYETADRYVSDRRIARPHPRRHRHQRAGRHPDAAGPPSIGFRPVRAVSPRRTRARRVQAPVLGASPDRWSGRHGGSEGRRLDRHAAEGCRSPAPPHRSLVTLVRRFSLVLVVLVSFLAGMVLTGRLRSAEPPDTQPGTRGAPCRARAGPRRQAGAGAQQGGAQQVAGTPTVPAVAALPDFTAVAAQTVRAVTNISSLQYVQRQNSPFANDPFFQYFFGCRRHVRRAQPARAEPRVGRSRVC